MVAKQWLLGVITGDTLAWVAAFLSDCSQQVVRNGVLFFAYKVNSEVPQSLFFAQRFSLCTLMTADGVQSQLCLFVDDCNISYSMVVLYSRDPKGLGVVHEKNPKISLTFS